MGTFVTQRSSGVLAPVTAIPGGHLGDDARRFLDWLAAAGVGWWQVLPLGPPDRHGSPYASPSAFAGWPGLLARPRARVTLDEELELRDRQAAWIGDWEAFAGGREAVRDQVRFDREWRAVRAHAAERGIRLVGDVPIYVAPGGADHRAHPELFRAGVVAGVPPDLFSATGQRWGNPLYDWPALRRRRYRWWVARLRRTFELVDLTRIDHFRAFVSYWAVPEDCPTAVEGRWVRGPGRAVFDAARAALGPLPMIAEDLGLITEPVHRLRDELGFPGMVVLQFGFDTAVHDASEHHPSAHVAHSVCYTGTHDNDTARGWWDATSDEVHGHVLAAATDAGVVEPEPWWTLVRLALASPARLAVVQLQDVLGLGSEARTNLPGRARGNWAWQASRRQLTPALAARLRAAVEASGRR
jgi:4-alpha-glucanotransferase